ncbi:MAG: hypothetical protein L0Z07_02920, partial [Planctomycetes bacterium]|nr:hypothetical protein [Planctomycetota bacterium]
MKTQCYLTLCLSLCGLIYGSSGKAVADDAPAVFREVTHNYAAQRHVRFVELDPDTKRVFTGEHLPQATMKRHV